MTFGDPTYWIIAGQVLALAIAIVFALMAGLAIVWASVAVSMHSPSVPAYTKILAFSAVAIVYCLSTAAAAVAVLLELNRTSFITMTSLASLYVLASLHQRLAWRRRRR